jgi:hypothetical protein
MYLAKKIDDQQDLPVVGPDHLLIFADADTGEWMMKDENGVRELSGGQAGGAPNTFEDSVTITAGGFTYQHGKNAPCRYLVVKDAEGWEIECNWRRVPESQTSHIEIWSEIELSNVTIEGVCWD